MSFYTHGLCTGLLIGFLAGLIIGTAVSLKAECCAQFQEHGIPDFNQQLEAERYETWQRAQQHTYIEPWMSPYGMRKEPC